MLDLENTLLVIVDVQGNLAHSMYRKEVLFKNIRELIKGMQALEMPIILTEQNPTGLGPTIPELAELLPDIQPIAKMSFSCCRNEDFMHALKVHNRNRILIAGIEAHICVYQTAVQLTSMGYEVEVVADAVGSRIQANRDIGLQKMRDSGIGVTCIETAFFELIETAEDKRFKKILRIVKEFM